MPDRQKQQRSQESDSNPGRKHASRTEGTDRDMDETGESKNQGHGHPREERSQQSRSEGSRPGRNT
jgi:hypothetical protein